MTQSPKGEIAKKGLSDVGAGLAAALGSTILLKLLSRRGRIVRTLTLAAVGAATTFARNRWFPKHKTTSYALTREVDRDPPAKEHDV